MSELVLVTGGAGFIGSHTCEALLAAGYRVRVLDNFSSGEREWVPDEVEVLRGDIISQGRCYAACDEVDYVIHLAAMSRAAPSLNAMEFCTSVNVVGTQNMLLAAHEANVKKFVYAGSATWYGNWPVAGFRAMTEDMPADFLNPYALSKGVGEQYALAFDRFYGLPVTVLRYFNVYGPRQPSEGQYALVLGIFLDRYRKGLPLEIHGDGSQRRDFVHVFDVVRANIAAILSPLHGEVFNIGSGTNISIAELADAISENQTYLSRRPGDARETLADIRAAERLPWKPEIHLAGGLLIQKDYDAEA